MSNVTQITLADGTQISLEEITRNAEAMQALANLQKAEANIQKSLANLRDLLHGLKAPLVTATRKGGIFGPSDAANLREGLQNALALATGLANQFPPVPPPVQEEGEGSPAEDAPAEDETPKAKRRKG